MRLLLRKLLLPELLRKRLRLLKRLIHIIVLLRKLLLLHLAPQELPQQIPQHHCWWGLLLHNHHWLGSIPFNDLLWMRPLLCKLHLLLLVTSICLLLICCLPLLFTLWRCGAPRAIPIPRLVAFQ